MIHSNSIEAGIKNPSLKNPSLAEAVPRQGDPSKGFKDSLSVLQSTVKNASADQWSPMSSKVPSVSSKMTATRFDIESAEGNARELPIHIVSTPSAELFQSESSSREVEVAARDILREGLLDSLLGSNFLQDGQSAYSEVLSRSSPIMPLITRSVGDTNYHLTSRLEQDIATTRNTSTTPSCSDEANSLRKQIARLGSVLQSGISEYQKLQDWVVQDHASDAPAQGVGLQMNNYATIANSLHPKQSVALEKARLVQT